MKKSLMFLFLVFLVMQASSVRYSDYTAIYMDRENLEKSIFYTETNRDLVNPGKIYHKHPYLFVNEKYKGVHIIDNSDPANPVKKGFIVAPGCMDVAVTDNIIYLDNSVDLVSFDMERQQEIHRIKNVFPEPLPPAGFYGYSNRPYNYILVEWVKR